MEPVKIEISSNDEFVLGGEVPDSVRDECLTEYHKAATAVLEEGFDKEITSGAVEIYPYLEGLDHNCNVINGYQFFKVQAGGVFCRSKLSEKHADVLHQAHAAGYAAAQKYAEEYA